MEDKALRGDQFALNLLNYMGSCWTVGSEVENTAVRMKRYKQRERKDEEEEEERSSGTAYSLYGKVILVSL